MSKSKVEIIQEGINAYNRGSLVSANPYDKYDQAAAYRAWAQGYYDAESEEVRKLQKQEQAFREERIRKESRMKMRRFI